MIRRAAIVFLCFLAGAAIASRELDRAPGWDCVFNVSFNRGDASDRSWLGANGTLTNGATTGSNRYLTLDGINDYVDHGTQSTHNAYPISVSCWFNLQGNDQAQYASLVDKYGTGSLNGWQLWVDTNEAIHFWYFAGSAANCVYGGGDGLLFSPSGYKAAGWHHVVAVIGSGGGTLYIDGASVDTQGWTGTPGACSASYRTALGVHNFGPRYYKGDLDDIRIYNRDLSAAEVAAIYATGRF